VNDTSGFKVVDVQLLLDAQFLRVENHTVEGPTGESADRIVILHPGAVAVVPIIDDDIILIDQYRAPVRANVLEIPAGKLDASDTSTEEAARRELLEETGFQAGRLVELTAILTAVGFTNEKITIYLAEGMTPGSVAPDGIEEDAATIIRIPFDEAVRRVVAGDIQDAKTIAGILLADAHRRRMTDAG
jgi:ADP-ribose pyrophosphatase